MKKIMGLDVGDRKVGVAISDALHMTAQGRETLYRDSDKQVIDQLITWIIEEDIEQIVVGMPKNMNGTIGPQGEKTQSFIKKLEKKIKYSEKTKERTYEIIYWDERLTSIAAERMLIEADVRRANRKKVIDTVAAVLILQGYLDSNR